MAEEKGRRIILRMTHAQFDLMKRLGGALGIEVDSQCAKHFFLLGMQSSMSSLTTSQNSDLLTAFQSFAQQIKEMDDGVEQLDLVDEAQKKKKPAPRARARA